MNLSSFKVHLITFFLFFFLFLNTFDNFPLYVLNLNIAVTQILNYTALVFSFILLIYVKSFSIKNLVIFSTILFLLLINYILTDYASFKWLINWVGFLFIFILQSEIYKKISNVELVKINKIILIYTKIFLLIFAFINLYYYYSNYNFLLENLSITKNYNLIIFRYSYLTGINKQSFGILLALIFIFFIYNFKSMNLIVLTIFLFCLSTFFPILIGIRTLTLSFFLFLILYLFVFNFYKYFYFNLTLIFIIFFILFFNLDILFDFVSNRYNRLPAIHFSIDILKDNIFGLGNGGYSIFVDKYNNDILYLYGNDAMIENRKSFWIAPESDIAYFFGSWGILSIPFFLALIWIIKHAFKAIMVFKNDLFEIEKVILTFSVIFILMGFSQDNAGSLSWWVYLGASFGIIQKHNLRNKK